MEEPKIITGTVVKHTGSHYLVSPLPLWEPVVCIIRGKLRTTGSSSTNPLAVGDMVDIELTHDGKGAIFNIHPRKNYIIRRSTNLSRRNHIIAANLDNVFLIVTMAFPEIKPEFTDRFLVTCEAYRVPVTIVVNKTDLLEETSAGKLKRFAEIYRSAGYDVLTLSVLRHEGIDEIRERCKGKISLFSGQSGVGKSSLINALSPDLNLRTDVISLAHEQGKHTTTFYEMHALMNGGFIIDTPGIRGFGLIDIQSDELSHYFPEMLKVLENCRFSPCTHTHEPGCAVKQAVENGIISVERYDAYINMLEQENGKYR